MVSADFNRPLAKPPDKTEKVITIRDVDPPTGREIRHAAGQASRRQDKEILREKSHDYHRANADQVFVRHEVVCGRPLMGKKNYL